MNKGTFKKGHKMPPEIRAKISRKMKGVKKSPKTIEKMKIAQKGVVKTAQQIERHRIAITGKKHSNSTKLKMSLGRQGNNHPNWKGGITPLYLQIRHHFKTRQWRSDCFTRDNFTCQECFERGEKLHCHHIKEFSDIIYEYSIKTLEQALECEELWNINNGVTLCENCHINKHKKNGNKPKRA